MKFLVDAQLPPALAAWICSKGHDAVSVREIGLREADDEVIWSHAARNDAIIVTKDEDFAFRASTKPGPRVLWVRTGNAVNRVLIARFENAWPQIVAHLEDDVRLVEVR